MTQNDSQEPAQVFISYAHEDERFRSGRWEGKLRVHLQVGVARGLIDLWSDKDIQAGNLWNPEIEERLRRTRVAVLLIGPGFLASDYIRKREMPILLLAWEEQRCRILPVVVRHCHLDEATYLYPDPQRGPGEICLKDLQAAHDPLKPLLGRRASEQDKTLSAVAGNIFKIAKGGSVVA